MNSGSISLVATHDHGVDSDVAGGSASGKIVDLIAGHD